MNEEVWGLDSTWPDIAACDERVSSLCSKYSSLSLLKYTLLHCEAQGPLFLQVVGYNFKDFFLACVFALSL